MKTQMRFQKILMLVTLIISAVTIVYAWGFFIGSLSCVSYMAAFRGTLPSGSGVSASQLREAATNTYYIALDVNDLLFALSIVFLLLVAFIYITASNKRRNYYVTNYIAIIATAAFAAVFAIIGIVAISMVLGTMISEIPSEIWDAYKNYCDTNNIKNYSDSNVMFGIGYVVFAIVLVNAAALIYNLIWKIKLMKGEKKLLAAKPEKEVA